MAFQGKRIMGFFKVLAGFHAIARPPRKSTNPTVIHPIEYDKYPTGSIIESDDDLCVNYPEKFERVIENTPVAANAKQRKKSLVGKRPDPLEPQEDTEETDDGNVALLEPPIEELPDPVEEGWKKATKDFPRAVANELMVWKKGAHYKVADMQQPRMMLNDGMLTRQGVVDFIKANYD